MKHILRELDGIILMAITSDNEPKKSRKIKDPRTIPYVLDGRMIPVNPKALGLEVKNYVEHLVDGVVVKVTYQLRKIDEEWSPLITAYMAEGQEAA